MVTPEALPRISIDNAALIPRPFKMVYRGCLSTPTEWFSEIHSPGANVADGWWGHISASDLC